jgi:hypothetical protein
VPILLTDEIPAPPVLVRLNIYMLSASISAERTRLPSSNSSLSITRSR